MGSYTPAHASLLMSIYGGISDLRVSEQSCTSEKLMEYSDEIPVSRWVKLQQAVVSVAPVYHEHASASEIVLSTKLGIWRW
jgi:hypothetical protein